MYKIINSSYLQHMAKSAQSNTQVESLQNQSKSAAEQIHDSCYTYETFLQNKRERKNTLFIDPEKSLGKTREFLQKKYGEQFRQLKAFHQQLDQEILRLWLELTWLQLCDLVEQDLKEKRRGWLPLYLISKGYRERSHQLKKQQLIWNSAESSLSKLNTIRAYIKIENLFGSNSTGTDASLKYLTDLSEHKDSNSFLKLPQGIIDHPSIKPLYSRYTENFWQQLNRSDSQLNNAIVCGFTSETVNEKIILEAEYPAMMRLNNVVGTRSRTVSINGDSSSNTKFEHNASLKDGLVSAKDRCIQKLLEIYPAIGKLQLVELSDISDEQQLLANISKATEFSFWPFHSAEYKAVKEILRLTSDTVSQEKLHAIHKHCETLKRKNPSQVVRINCMCADLAIHTNNTALKNLQSELNSRDAVLVQHEQDVRNAESYRESHQSSGFFIEEEILNKKTFAEIDQLIEQIFFRRKIGFLIKCTDEHVTNVSTDRCSQLLATLKKNQDLTSANYYVLNLLIYLMVYGELLETQDRKEMQKTLYAVLDIISNEAYSGLNSAACSGGDQSPIVATFCSSGLENLHHYLPESLAISEKVVQDIKDFIGNLETSFPRATRSQFQTTPSPKTEHKNTASVLESSRGERASSFLNSWTPSSLFASPQKASLESRESIKKPASFPEISHASSSKDAPSQESVVHLGNPCSLPTTSSLWCPQSNQFGRKVNDEERNSAVKNIMQVAFNVSRRCLGFPSFEDFNHHDFDCFLKIRDSDYNLISNFYNIVLVTAILNWYRKVNNNVCELYVLCENFLLDPVERYSNFYHNFQTKLDCLDQNSGVYCLLDRYTFEINDEIEKYTSKVIGSCDLSSRHTSLLG